MINIQNISVYLGSLQLVCDTWPPAATSLNEWKCMAYCQKERQIPPTVAASGDRFGYLGNRNCRKKTFLNFIFIHVLPNKNNCKDSNVFKIWLHLSPTPFSSLVLQTERQVSRWFVQCLREQSMLLEIIFLYYAYFEMAPGDLLVLTKMFKEQGFGSRQTNRHLVDETMDPFVDRIG